MFILGLMCVFFGWCLSDLFSENTFVNQFSVFLSGIATVAYLKALGLDDTFNNKED